MIRNNGGWRFYRDYEVWSDSFKLFATHEGPDGVRAVVKPLELHVIERGVSHKEATLSSEHFDVSGFLQAAMDCAWELGLRPSGFADSANELKATRYHLEDMRALAKVPPR